jgi:hypothetical protein
MRPFAAACLFASALATAAAQQVIIYQPQPPVTVVSPLTTAPVAANQNLLNQINGTLTQRRFQHDVLTTNATLRALQPPPQATR